MIRFTLLALLSSSLIACAGGEDPSGGADAGRRCTNDIDCDDSISCTVDTCAAGNVCSNMALDGLCADGETCSATRGCTASSDCTTAAECDDSIECTVDSCGMDLTCRHMALNELCDAGETCDPAMGCVAGSGCASAADCDDGIDCTNDTCAADMTCRNMAIDALCPDGQTCSETTGCFTPMPCEMDVDCDDGNFCNGDEVCMPEFGCAPAPSPRMCNDSNDCTMDSCDSTANMCLFACDASRSECMCSTIETPCDGTFVISPPPMQRCAMSIFGGGYQVDYNVMTVTFSCVGDVLSISAGVPRATLDSALTQTPRPTDGSFDASTTVPGGDAGCTEDYRLVGAFTGPDTFTATFTARYTGFCTGSGCVDQSIMVTGTRM